MTSLNVRERLVFPLDYPDLAAARSGAAVVAESAGVLKVGLELFVSEGPSSVQLARELGCDVFLDLKLHDIPETVARAVGSAGQLGVRYLTLHAQGGPRMLEAAQARAERDGTGLVLLAVTVLTSLDAADLQLLGLADSPADHALRLAQLARRAGLRGLVCSTAEVRALREAMGPDFVLVTPGIRPAAASLGSADLGNADDQRRVGTPTEALRAGASLLVVGRPIRDAADPRSAARSVLGEMSEAVSANALP